MATSAGRQLTAVGEILMVDVVTVMLSASTTVACRMRLAVPTPLRSAVIDTGATFPDSAGRLLDAFDYAVARAVCAAGSAVPARLASGVEIASALPSARAVAVDATSGRVPQTLFRHARPLQFPQVSGRDTHPPPARKARTETAITRCFVFPAGDCSWPQPVRRGDDPFTLTVLPGERGDADCFSAIQASLVPGSLTALDLSRHTTLTTLDAGSCAYRSKLQDVELPSGLTSLGVGFAKLSGLTSLDLSHCTALRELEDGSLSHCKDLRAVKLPPGLTSLCFGACRYTGLTRLDASQCCHLSQISDNVLEKCTALHSLALPASLADIGAEFCARAAQLELLDLSHCVLKFGTHLKLGTASSWTVRGSES